jgi:hypothetical protein
VLFRSSNIWKSTQGLASAGPKSKLRWQQYHLLQGIGLEGDQGPSASPGDLGGAPCPVVSLAGWVLSPPHSQGKKQILMLPASSTTPEGSAPNLWLVTITPDRSEVMARQEFHPKSHQITLSAEHDSEPHSHSNTRSTMTQGPQMNTSYALPGYQYLPSSPYNLMGDCCSFSSQFMQTSTLCAGRCALEQPVPPQLATAGE